MLVVLLPIISAIKKFDEFSISLLSITDTELPTSSYDCGVFPGEITIIGISAAFAVDKLKIINKYLY